MGITVDIQKKLGDFRLDIDFESDARRIGILGPSGCGKSMTLKSIAGIEQPDAGRIIIAPQDSDVTESRVLFDSAGKVNLKPQRRNVGYMFQNYALFPTMNVMQNIAAGIGSRGEEREARVREMIDRFRLRGLEKHLPSELSGGQQQRVALARIMAYKTGSDLARRTVFGAGSASERASAARDDLNAGRLPGTGHHGFSQQR